MNVVETKLSLHGPLTKATVSHTDQLKPVTHRRHASRHTRFCLRTNEHTCNAKGSIVELDAIEIEYVMGACWW